MQEPFEMIGYFCVQTGQCEKLWRNSWSAEGCPSIKDTRGEKRKVVSGFEHWILSSGQGDWVESCVLLQTSSRHCIGGALQHWNLHCRTLAWESVALENCWAVQLPVSWDTALPAEMHTRLSLGQCEILKRPPVRLTFPHSALGDDITFSGRAEGFNYSTAAGRGGGSIQHKQLGKLKQAVAAERGK